MTRVAVAGCMALAGLGVVAVLDVGSTTADAAPSASGFAGTYAWSGWPAAITISDGGQITSSYSGAGRSKGSISGGVTGDGRYSFTLSETYYVEAYETERRVLPYPVAGAAGTTRLPEGIAGPVYKPPRARWITSRAEFTGTMAPDASGNIIGTADTGGSFVWLRQ